MADARLAVVPSGMLTASLAHAQIVDSLSRKRRFLSKYIFSICDSTVMYLEALAQLPESPVFHLMHSNFHAFYVDICLVALAYEFSSTGADV